MLLQMKIPVCGMMHLMYHGSIYLCLEYLNISVVELMQSHTNTQSHWSSGSTVCFPPRGAEVHVPGMHLHSHWNWGFLLAMSRYIGDPDVIQSWPCPLWDASLGSAPSCRDHTSLAFPSSIHTHRRISQTQWHTPLGTCKAQGLYPVTRGGPVELQQSQTNTLSHWSSGSTICFSPRRVAVCVPRTHPHLHWNWGFLLAMSLTWFDHWSCPLWDDSLGSRQQCEKLSWSYIIRLPQFHPHSLRDLTDTNTDRILV